MRSGGAWGKVELVKEGRGGQTTHSEHTDSPPAQSPK